MKKEQDTVGNSFGKYYFEAKDGELTLTYGGRRVADGVFPIVTDAAGKTVASGRAYRCRSQDTWRGGDFFPIVFEGGPACLPAFKLDCRFSMAGVSFAAVDLPEGFSVGFSGFLHFGEAATPVTEQGAEGRLRAAFGPAVRAADTALYDRDTDRLLSVGGEGARLFYDRAAGLYGFKTAGKMTLSVRGRILEDGFGVAYHPINKNTVFPKPPAGWMTWYAVKFGACEDKILENTRFQAEHLKAYGADTVWVDWEWYHAALDDADAKDSIGYMAPDPARYPRGLAPIAEEIRRAGFVPALWIAPTVEPAYTETVRQYEDSVILRMQTWCGRYFFDTSDERIRDNWIPEALRMVPAWGYEALKWDCLMVSLTMADRCRSHQRHPETDPIDALRAIVESGRRTVGKDFFMMAVCSSNRAIRGFGDLFDSIRIGDDIFSFEEFSHSFVKRVQEYYPLHNNLCYCDPDNLVLREEYNTLPQAQTRVSLITLLGLPATFGDDLPALPAERLHILRRALPTMDIRAADLRSHCPAENGFLQIALAVSKPFEEWDVLGVFNGQDEERTASLTLADAVSAEAGAYRVFEFWSQRYLGTFNENDNVTLQIPAHGTAVLHVRRALPHPQIVGTNRHVAGGAVDLLDARFDDNACTLRGSADTVAGEAYLLTLFVPEGYRPTDGVVGADRLMQVDLGTAGGRRDFAVRFETE